MTWTDSERRKAADISAISTGAGVLTDAGCALRSASLRKSRWPGEDWKGCENRLRGNGASKHATLPAVRIRAAISIMHIIASIEPGKS